MFPNSDAVFWRFSLDPNRDPKAEMMGEEYVRVAGMLLVLSDQQVNALLRDACRGWDVVTEL